MHEINPWSCWPVLSGYLVRQAALQHTVPGDLAHVAGAELEDLRCNSVLLHQGFLWAAGPAIKRCSTQKRPCTHLQLVFVFPHLGVVELHGVISWQRNHQAFLMELQQWVLGVLQEQAVVAERGHGDGDLGQEVQVLQHGALLANRIGLCARSFHNSCLALHW